MNGIAFGNDLFVGVGYGWVVTSTLYGIRYGGGVFVTVGAVNTILSSVDGNTWFRREAFLGQYANFTAVTYGNGTFVAVGQFSNPSAILVSLDGVTWRVKASETENSLNGIAYGAGRFVAVGADGTILQSGDVSTPTLALRSEGTNGFVITLEGEVGRGYRIQSATDLVHWEDWVQLTNSKPVTEVQAWVAPLSDQRFFRAVSPWDNPF